MHFVFTIFTFCKKHENQMVQPNWVCIIQCKSDSLTLAQSDGSRNGDGRNNNSKWKMNWVPLHWYKFYCVTHGNCNDIVTVNVTKLFLSCELYECTATFCALAEKNLYAKCFLNESLKFMWLRSRILSSQDTNEFNERIQ